MLAYDEIVELVAGFCDGTEEGGQRPLRQKQSFVLRGGRKYEEFFERCLH